jgi:hypothetical protein
MNQAARIKAEQQQAKAQVMRMLNWNDQQFANFQFEMGFEYLKFWIGEDQFGFAELPQTASFWAWWRNHWHKRDLEFISRSATLSVNECRRFYRLFHDAEAIEYQPNSVVMDDAYAQMIYNLTHTAQ